MISHLFPTPITHSNVPAPAEDAANLLAYLQEMRAKSSGERRSNVGGWHSPSDLCDPAKHPQFPGVMSAITNGLLEYFGSVMGYKGELQFSLSMWAVINRVGDTNAPHTHPSNLLSGAYYLQIPTGMVGGEIVFMDPRGAVNSYGSERKDRAGLKAPWDSPNVGHTPKQGDLIIFPSWLPHYVKAFGSEDPTAERVVISFNAAV